MSGGPIPHIAVTTDLHSTHSLHSSEDDRNPHSTVLVSEPDNQTMSPESDHFPPTPVTPQSGGLQSFHTRSPSDPAFLSPFGHGSTGGGRTSLDVPPRTPSPGYASSNEGTMAPPSPTLSSRSSVHFATSVALRDNKPGDGNSSLGLLNVDKPGKHSRKPSWASSGEGHSSLEGTEPDHGNLAPGSLHRATSAATSMTLDSPTQTHVDNLSERSRSRSRSRAKKDSADSDGVTAISDSEGRPSGDARKRGKGKVSDAGDEEDDPKSGRLELEDDSDDVSPAPFKFRPFFLASMLDPKNLESLEEIGGVDGLLKGLGTSQTRGLGKKALMTDGSFDAGGGDGKSGKPGAGLEASQRHDRDLEEGGNAPNIVVTGPDDGGDGDDENDEVHSASLDIRRKVYGANEIPHRATKSLLALMWLALKDKVLVLLSIAAIVSLALGLFQDFGTPTTGPKVDWVEGVAIMIAIFIVVMVGSINDWQKERQFEALNEKKEERGVKVIRNGEEKIIDVKEVVVGDIALLEPGEIVPCDGVFLTGHNVKCDESGATGESDAIKKVSYEECIRLRNKAREDADGGDHHGGMGHGGMGHTDCFVVSGSKVLEGVGSYVVVAVGTKSFNGRIMMALRTDTENTPLQLKLNALAELIAKLGSAAGLILFTALLIRFFVQLGKGEPVRTANQKGIAFVQILIISVTLIVVAVPEGLKH